MRDITGLYMIKCQSTFGTLHTTALLHRGHTPPRKQNNSPHFPSMTPSLCLCLCQFLYHGFLPSQSLYGHILFIQGCSQWHLFCKLLRYPQLEVVSSFTMYISLLQHVLLPILYFSYFVNILSLILDSNFFHNRICS